MIKFEPFPIIINGNTRDDLLWQLEDNPDPLYLNEIELRPSYGQKAGHYERQVQNCLIGIGHYKTGRLVLGHSLNLRRKFYIVPLGERDFQIANKVCAVTHAETLVRGRGNPTTRIRFTPYKSGSCAVEPDDAILGLFHELVHAVRPNTTTTLTAVDADIWTNLEEFFATVVENIFRSERGDKRLRKGHGGDALSASEATNAGFLSDPVLRKRVEEAYKREPLARKLARHPEIAFNPFAAFAGTAVAPKAQAAARP